MAFFKSKAVLTAAMVTLGVFGLSRSTLSDPPPLKVGNVFSSAQAASQSFLRFYNTGVGPGTVKVILANAATGQMLTQWISPNIPAGAEQQFAIATLEAAATTPFTKPAYYNISVQPAMDGYFQHVLFRPDDGTLTNLSTCGAGITATASELSGVHSSLLDYGFPSTVVAVNTGTGATTASLGVYDAATGAKLGSYTTASIAPGAQARLDVKGIETAIGVTPTGTMYHYVIKAESEGTGFLQHLVYNKQKGVVTDMTTACALNSVAAPFVASTALKVGSVFSSAQATSQSFLRFYNTGSIAGSVQITLKDSAGGGALSQWTSPVIPAGSEQQFAISTLDGALAARPDYYSIDVQASNLTGYFQHVLFRPTDGTLTNLSTCYTGITADPGKLSGVHSSLLDYGFPSTVAVNNTGAAAAAAALGVYDAATGTKLGVYTTAAIPVGAQVMLGIKTIETAIGVTPTGTMYHYVIKVEGHFTGFLQHLVNNLQAGVVTDMTTACEIPPAATFAELTPAKFSAALPVTSVLPVKADNPTKTSSLAYLLAESYGTGNLFGNGRNDIIVAPTYSDQHNAIPIEFWRNNGDGTFTNRTTDLLDTPVTTETVNNVFVADLNGDGRDDVFLVDGGWEIKPAPYYGAFNHLLLSGPDGKLHDASATLPQSTKSYNHKSTMVDFNGDGCMDFIITELGGQSTILTSGVYVLINDCAGHFTKLSGLPVGFAQRTTGIVPQGVTSANQISAYHTTAADLNGDGKVDLIVGGTNFDDKLHAIRIYDAATNFSQVAKLYMPNAIVSATPTAGPVSIVPVDIDGDGKLDLVVHYEVSGTTRFFWAIYRNLGNYQFSDVTLQYLPSYEISNLPGGNTNMRKLVLKEVSRGTNALVAECGQFALAAVLQDGKCIFTLNPNAASPAQAIAQWRPTYMGRDITDAELNAIAPQRSFTCPVRGGTQLVFDVDGDGVMDLVYVNGQCVTIPTADLPQMTSNLQVIVFPSGKR